MDLHSAVGEFRITPVVGGGKIGGFSPVLQPRKAGVF
jgi:hypothetical protein